MLSELSKKELISEVKKYFENFWVVCDSSCMPKTQFCQFLKFHLRFFSIYFDMINNVEMLVRFEFCVNFFSDSCV